MPVARRTTETTTDDQSDHLRPYTFHGVDLTIKGQHGVGDCPFCGKEGHFAVAVDSGLWRCLVCGTGTDKGGGNALTFLRLLHAQSMSATNSEFLRRAAADRKLLHHETLTAWGVCQSILTREWLIPGYSQNGVTKLDQLYRRVWMSDSEGKWSWKLLPTPGIWPEGKVHALHLSTFDPTKPNVVVCEGSWDGMALWEVWRPDDINIVAVPGCNVWRDEWSEMCRGKHVTLLFDSDHPIPAALAQGKTIRAGLDGMCRVAKRLSGIAASVRFIRWGPEGYNLGRPSGWDVRDHLSSAVDRKAALNDLFAKVEVAPADWFTPYHLNGTTTKSSSSPDVEPEACHEWVKCEEAWRNALEWRSELGDAMTVMLAVAASTKQSGDNQLCLQVIGDPGSAKTRMCKGLLVSKTCKIVLHLKSFHSGFRGDDGKDVSFVSRINGFCLVTPEIDALAIGMSWDQLNSQMRQIFDGESAHTYGNSSEDTHYKGLRCPWIQAGTPSMMDRDQSRLGDRFIRIRIEEPAEVTKRAILLRALRNERSAVLETSNGTSASIIPPKMRRAYALTGGYVDWLRANIEDKIAQVDMGEYAEQRCIDLASLVADMRARPNMDPKKVEVHHTKELPTRLVGQFGRLSLCLAVVLNKRSVDTEVLRIVRRVALDTAHGHSLNVARWLCSPCPKKPSSLYQEYGIETDTLAVWCGMTPQRMQDYMLFLRKISVVELKQGMSRTNVAWVLTQRVFDLYIKVIGG